MKNKRYLFFLGCLCSLFFALQSCNEDNDALKENIDHLNKRVTVLESAMEQFTASVSVLNKLQQEEAKIVGITPLNGGYRLELSTGEAYEVASAQEVEGLLPQLAINEEGCWEYSIDGGKTFVAMLTDGKPVRATDIDAKGITPELRVSADGFWQVSYDKGTTFTDLLAEGQRIPAFEGVSASSIFNKVNYNAHTSELEITLTANNQSLTFPVIDTFYLKVKGVDKVLEMPIGAIETFEVEQGDVDKAIIKAPAHWVVQLTENELRIEAPKKASEEMNAEIQVVITSSKGYIRIVTLPVSLINTRYENAPKSWREFESGDANNILPDFSFAGYKHGEIAPPSVEELKAQGYTVYDVTDYGAVANDGKSDRHAFIKVLEAMGAVRGKDKDAIRYQMSAPAKAIIYFPEGEFVLQGEGESNEKLRLTFGDYVIKGAGRDKTFLKMDVQNEPTRPDQMWSSPTLLELKHNSGLQELSRVVADAAKGTFAVEVGSTMGINVGDWVCLTLENNDMELIKQEFQPWAPVRTMTNLLNKGIQIQDYHQVVSIRGNKVVFKEPLMHAVEAKWDWKICKYPHYENVGVEDITFVGKAKDDFAHHASAADDGAYKIIDFVRLTNSWMRRVDFVSVSEAASIVSSANVSVYDVNIRGNRGHSAIRSQASSRVFIGKVTDLSDGYEAITSNSHIGGTIIKGAGQYHACGVSKQSMGAVIWNVHWGQDSNFESHATQPRATLIDHCKGAFIPWRQGGDEVQLPNHMEDLVIWNMNATRVKYDASWGGKFIWWDANNRWWKNLPPTIVGFHGEKITFGNPEKQLKRLESNGEKVEPASLYEAQLLKRLGYVPAWLSALK